MRILRILQTILVDLPRWGLLGLLVLAPWIYGSTRPEGKFFLTAGLLVVLGLFLLSLLARLRLPKDQYRLCHSDGSAASPGLDHGA